MRKILFKLKKKYKYVTLEVHYNETTFMLNTTTYTCTCISPGLTKCSVKR